MKKTFFILNLFFLNVVFLISISISASEKTKIIYIDPGHGGIDGGCVSELGVYEKDVVLDISYYLKEFFNLNGYKVYLTREGDYDLASDNAVNRKHEDILKRVEKINLSEAILCISIHANAFPDSDQRGAQVFYNGSSIQSQMLSENIQNNIIKYLNNTKRKESVIKNKYILDNVRIPICIVEVGFLSNYSETKLLCSENYKKVMAFTIGIGTLEYINSNYKT